MVLKYLYGWWNAPGRRPAAGAVPVGLEDPDIDDVAVDGAPGPAERKRKIREQEEQSQRQLRERDVDAARKAKRDDEDFEWRMLIATEFQRNLRQLSSDIDDAINAARQAHAHAAREQELAQEALFDAEGNALVLSDGSRVYFARTGRRLYAENGREITNSGQIAEARDLRLSAPDATDYETHAQRRRESALADERAEKVETSLQRLTQLKDRLRQGSIGPGELEQARHEADDIVKSLPPDVRADYERIRAARQPGAGIAYRPADAGPQSTPDIGLHFQQASAPQPPASGDKNPAPDPDLKPAYRSAPDF